jgi:hypothetical protein
MEGVVVSTDVRYDSYKRARGTYDYPSEENICFFSCGDTIYFVHMEYNFVTAPSSIMYKAQWERRTQT